MGSTSARSSRDDVLPIIQFPDVLPEVGAPNAGVALHIHVIPKCQHHLLDLDGQLPGGAQAEHLGLPHSRVDRLEDGDGECGSFSSTRLCLCNHVSSLDDWLDCTLLDGGRLLKAISIDAPEKVLPECHGVEGGDDLDILARLKLNIGQVLLLHSSPSLLRCHPCGQKKSLVEVNQAIKA